MALTRDQKTISRILASEANNVVQEEYSYTQEHQITASIAERLKTISRNMQLGKTEIAIEKQDIKDRGGESDEYWIGADLFLSLSTNGPGSFDKSLIIQAKKMPASIDNKLIEKCEYMLLHTSASYIWVYSQKEIRVIHANEILSYNKRKISDIDGITLYGFFINIFECNAGSKKIGIPFNSNRKKMIEEKIREFEAKNGLDIKISHKNKRKSFRDI